MRRAAVFIHRSGVHADRNVRDRALFIPGIPPDFLDANLNRICWLIGIKDNSGAGPSSGIFLPPPKCLLQTAIHHELASLKLTRSGRKLRIYGSQEPAATFSMTSRLEFANMFGVRGNPWVVPIVKHPPPSTRLSSYAVQLANFIFESIPPLCNVPVRYFMNFFWRERTQSWNFSRSGHLSMTKGSRGTRDTI
jgi:hypothetical protein